ncbi:hypothetical protein TNCV_1868241 [Trichonephila clavipes]|nr:hypothetical protein TNCV_1868241 [Trichonephila clavipes]
MLTETYGDEAMSSAHVFEWHKRFTGGRDSVEDEKRDKRPCIEVMKKLREKNRVKRPELRSDGCLLNQDNVSAHMA